MFKKFLIALLIPLIFLIDRVSKLLILERFSEGAGFPVIPGALHVTRVNNTGAAFGILKNSGTFLIVFSAVSVILFAFFFFGKKSGSFRSPAERWTQLAWALVIGGALGNLYDRLRFGYVIDFIDLRVWPVFNIADACICAGAGLLILKLFKGQKD